MHIWQHLHNWILISNHLLNTLAHLWILRKVRVVASYSKQILAIPIWIFDVLVCMFFIRSFLLDYFKRTSHLGLEGTITSVSASHWKSSESQKKSAEVSLSQSKSMQVSESHLQVSRSKQKSVQVCASQFKSIQISVNHFYVSTSHLQVNTIQA